MHRDSRVSDSSGEICVAHEFIVQRALVSCLKVARRFVSCDPADVSELFLVIETSHLSECLLSEIYSICGWRSAPLPTRAATFWHTRIVVLKLASVLSFVK